MKQKEKQPDFLKSSALRDFTSFDAGRLSEDEAFGKLVEIRYGDYSHVICPHCGSIDRHYFRKNRKQWRCKDCDGYFSLTTATPFEDHKLPFQKILFGIMLFISSANGIAAHRLARDMDVSVKTAHAFRGKIRESLYGIRCQEKLSGVIHIDGGHFGGRPRHGRVRRKSKEDVQAHVEAKIMNRKQRHKGRSKDNFRRLQNRRIVMTIRELFPEEGKGACKTITAICMAENASYALDLAEHFIEPGSTVMSDENPAYNQFSKWFEHKVVNHSEEFATIDGVNENQAESYFSRLRRYVLGVSHRIQPKYMADIAAEMSWREDMRRKTQMEKLTSLLGAAFANGQSKWWRGYWQGCNRKGELLWMVV